MGKLFFLGLIFVSFVFSLIFLGIPVSAQEQNSTISAKLQSGGSYEVFWPLTAGKTMDDSFYFLKLWKENLGGIFIFDAARKADYDVMLSTKRVLEAEKLLKEGKENLAAKTLDKALVQLKSAQGKFSKATKSGNDFQLVKTNLLNQLSNLDAFIPKLVESSKGDLQGGGLQVKDVVEKFISDIKQP